MNSIFGLNQYSAFGVYYTDDRPYSITLSSTTTFNSNISPQEGIVYNLIPGINITSLNSAPANVTYTINTNSVPGTQVNFGNTIPQQLIVSNVAGVYTVANIRGAGDWNSIRSPAITMPRDYSGNLTISANLSFPNPANLAITQVYSWNNNITVANLPEISTSVGNVTYNQFSTTFINPAAQITDNGADGIYNLVISSNDSSAINNIVSQGNGGTSNFASNVLTISGLRNQVNSQLSSMYFTPAQNYANNFIMTYTLTNPVSNVVSSVTQNFLIGNKFPVLSTPGNISYTQDSNIAITNYSILPSDSYWSTPFLYTVTVTPSDTAAISSITSTGTGGSANFNSATKQFTISNATYSQVDSYLNSLTLVPTAYYNKNFNLIYQVTAPGGTPVTQAITIGPVGVALSNVTDITYDEDSYLKSVVAPTIVDTNFGSAINDAFTMHIFPANTSAISTITTTGSATTSFNGTTKNYTITGNLAQVRNQLTTLQITTAISYVNNFSLYYTLTNTSGNVSANVGQNWLIGNANVITTINSTSNRNYQANNIQLLFPNAAPQIYETISATPTYQVTLTLGSNIGKIGTIANSAITGWNSGNLTYVVRGTKSTINSALANVYIIPNRDISTTTTLNFKQYRNDGTADVLQTSSTVTLTGSANSITPAVYVLTDSTQTFTPTLQQSYFCQCDILVIAGGGGGGQGAKMILSNLPQHWWYNSTYPDGLAWINDVPYQNIWGGGGGAGGLIPLLNTNIFNSTPLTPRTITTSIGSGGLGGGFDHSYGIFCQPGTHGGDTFIFDTTTSTILYYAWGGCYGGYGAAALNIDNANFKDFLGGGSGGGGCYPNASQSYTLGSGQGNNGGNHGDSSTGNPGGGGGYSSAGNTAGGAGSGYVSNIRGFTEEYSKGGGSKSYFAYPTTYGGGGGGANGDGTPTAGAQGAVIIKFY